MDKLTVNNNKNNVFFPTVQKNLFVICVVTVPLLKMQ